MKRSQRGTITAGLPDAFVDIMHGADTRPQHVTFHYFRKTADVTYYDISCHTGAHPER